MVAYTVYGCKAITMTENCDVSTLHAEMQTLDDLDVCAGNLIKYVELLYNNMIPRCLARKMIDKLST